MITGLILFGIFLIDVKPHSKDKAYKTIEEKTGYKQENIEEALKVMIYGQNDENATYRCITDIPFELQDACMHAISKHGTDSDIYAAWGGNN